MFESETELESKPCPNGCLGISEKLFDARDRLHNLPGVFQVMRCIDCGLIRTDPRPTAETMGAYYPDDYGPYVDTSVNVNTGDWKIKLRSVYRFLFPNRSLAIPDLTPGRMLEIGCASGAFMQEMSDKGWQVEGIEFSESAAENAREAGLSVRSGAVESVCDYDATFDLVIGWMVLEHLHDPVGSLKKLAGWSRPDGWLAISVPNAGSLEFNLFKGSGYALHIPNHLYHFSPETLTTLLDKSGWKVERILHQRTLSNWIGGIGYKLEDWDAPIWLSRIFKNYPGRPGLMTLMFYPISWLFALFGQTGRMTVWARRKD
jgi:2-polyprenyl-3-methyl-5-hydroxy-6-metoxy-1,4-benzoquinol methylase